MNPEEQERQRRKIQKQLDDALAESFPASDPVSIVTSQDEEDWGEDAGGAQGNPGGVEVGGVEAGGGKRNSAEADPAVKGR
ncbi:MAG TPA: hypothetical protein VMT29_16065 [Steroidobacteraceae bacterium]|nr:hypothetical protein [Steroidobacteraceae bacterium]